MDGASGEGTGGEAGADWSADYLFAVGAKSWLVHIAVTGLTFAVLVSDDAGGPGRSPMEAWPAAWLAAMLLLGTSLAFLGRRYMRLRADGPVPGVRRFAAFHTVLTGVVGLAWGIGALLVAASAEPQVTTLYTLVLGGTALGAVASQHALPRSCLVSIWTSIPLLGLAHVVGGLDIRSGAAAAMILLFGAILTLVALRMHGFLAEKVSLVAQLGANLNELETTAAALGEAHASRLRFLAQASHDLRQPVHAIGLFVECLRGLRIGSDGRAILHNIDRSLESLARLCRSLLDLSALDIGEVRPEPVAFPLDDILGEVVRQAEEQAGARGMRLRRVPTRIWVRTDPALLHVIVQNLVTNALKYAPGATLLVGVRRGGGAGETVTLMVADTGPGIPAADRARVFDEFVRLEPTRGGHAEGLGLGLSIVRRVADLLDIRVELRSGSGRGAVFLLSGVPRVPPGPHRTVGRPRSVPGSRLHGLRVLVIDNDADNRESAVRALGRWGCSVTTVAGCEDAMPLIGEADLLLCDQDLGAGIDGIGTIRRLRTAAGRRLPALLATGTDISALRDEARAETVMIAAKPVRPAQLRSMLLAAVSGSGQTSPSVAASPAAADRDLTPSARNSAET